MRPKDYPSVINISAYQFFERQKNSLQYGFEEHPLPKHVLRCCYMTTLPNTSTPQLSDT